MAQQNVAEKSEEFPRSSKSTGVFGSHEGGAACVYNNNLNRVRNSVSVIDHHQVRNLDVGGVRANPL